MAIPEHNPAASKTPIDTSEILRRVYDQQYDALRVINVANFTTTSTTTTTSSSTSTSTSAT